MRDEMISYETKKEKVLPEGRWEPLSTCTHTTNDGSRTLASLVLPPHFIFHFS
jgi:hypothetical protein